MTKETKITLCFMTCAVLALVLAGPALAIDVPEADSFAYDVYDLTVNKILSGPIGFVAGLAGVALGAILAMQQRIMGAFPAILGGAVLIKAGSITESLGLIF